MLARSAMLADLLEARIVGRPTPREPRQKATRKQSKTPESDSAAYYISVKLGGKSRDRLLRHVSPKHSEVTAEHVTLLPHPTPEEIERYRAMEGKQVSFHATHHAHDADSGVQAVRVRGLDHLSDKPHKHVTISTGRGIPAARSNDLLAQTRGEGFRDWIPLTGTIEVARRLGGRSARTS